MIMKAVMYQSVMPAIRINAIENVFNDGGKLMLLFWCHQSQYLVMALQYSA